MGDVSYPPGTGGRRWDGTPALDLLLARARSRLEVAGHDMGAATTFAGSDLDAVRRLITGFRHVGALTKSVTVSMREIDAWLNRPLNGGRGLLEVLGPLGHRPRERAELEAYREEDRRVVTDLLGHTRWLAAWMDYLEQGSLTRLAGTPHVRNAARVLASLPASGITLTELVEQSTGDTKALTRGPALGLALRALAFWFDLPFSDDAVTRRRLWAHAGVVVDSLSVRVLVLGVRCAGSSTLARWLGEASDDGIPFVVTMHHLERFSVTLDSPQVSVCENPAVMEAAARELGPHSTPLICTEGQPSAAVSVLLAGFEGKVRWRGDFDWTGLRTTTSAIARFGAVPWRMDADTYRHGLARGDSEFLKAGDRQCESAWDPSLASAMRDSGRAVMEERIVDELLTDLTYFD